MVPPVVVKHTLTKTFLKMVTNKPIFSQNVVWLIIIKKNLLSLVFYSFGFT